MKVNYFLGTVLFILCLFPYVSLINTPFDTQPYALLFSAFIITLFIAQKNFHIPSLLFPYGIILAYSCLLLFTSPSLFNGLRSVAGYSSVLLISLASYFTFKSVKGKTFIITVSVWMAFGLLQNIVDKRFGEFLISRLSTSASRGVTSLAVEPSYYSVICIFFLIINDVFAARKEYSKRTYNILFSMIVLQLLFARAGLGVALFLFTYLLRWFHN